MDDLRDPEFRRNFVVAYYEEDGIAGLKATRDEIACADGAVVASELPLPPDDFTALRGTVNALGLDFRLVPVGT